jgi:hypothetical protein
MFQDPPLSWEIWNDWSPKERDLCGWYCISINWGMKSVRGRRGLENTDQSLTVLLKLLCIIKRNRFAQDYVTSKCTGG